MRGKVGGQRRIEHNQDERPYPIRCADAFPNRTLTAVSHALFHSVRGRSQHQRVMLVCYAPTYLATSLTRVRSAGQ